MHRNSTKSIERAKKIASLSEKDAVKFLTSEKDGILKMLCDKCGHKTSFFIDRMGRIICKFCHSINSANFNFNDKN